MQPCTLKRLLLVVCQPLQVFLRTPKSNRISQSPGCCYVIYNLLLWHTEKILVKNLQILLLCKRNLYKILQSLYLGNIYLISLKHPPVVCRIGVQISQRLVQQPILKSFNPFRRLKFNIHIIVYHSIIQPYLPSQCLTHNTLIYRFNNHILPDNYLCRIYCRKRNAADSVQIIVLPCKKQVGNLGIDWHLTSGNIITIL